jgi:hypothetical protein
MKVTGIVDVVFTATPCTPPQAADDKLCLQNIMAITAKATLFFRADRGETVSIGFVQVVNLLSYKATYNKDHVRGADATRETTIPRYPIRDAMRGAKPPWYCSTSPWTKLIIGTGAETCEACALDDSPSPPTLPRVDPTYGNLCRVVCCLKFTTWLAYFNHSIARIVALGQATTSMDLDLDIVSWPTEPKTFLPPTVRTTGLQRVPENTKIPLEVWNDKVANGSTITGDWQKAPGYDNVLAQRAKDVALLGGSGRRRINFDEL